MAIARLGTAELFQSTTQDTTHSATIPSGCDCIVIAITGYLDTNTTTLVDVLSFDGAGIDLNQVGYARYLDSYNAVQVDVYVMTATSGAWPGTGSKTLTVQAPSARQEGYNVGLAYYSGVNQSTPTGSTDAHNAPDDGTSFTSALTGMASGDLGMVAAYDYGAPPTVSGNSQTTILTPSGALANAGFALAEKADESAMVASAPSLIALAWALKVAGGAAATSNTIITSHQRVARNMYPRS
jgi:hypothetical protein